MTMLVPEGQRGVTIKLDEAVRESGFLLPNSRVDVLVSMPKAPGSQEKIAKVILQDVTVLAAGQTVELRDNKPVTNTTVTLSLTPDQTERLAVAQAVGKLMLVQRNLRDTQFVRTTGATPSSLLSDGVIASPQPKTKPTLVRSAPLPLPTIEKYPVAVFRGSKVSNQLLVNGKAVGVTSLVVFYVSSQQTFDLVVHPGPVGAAGTPAVVTQDPHAVWVQRGDKMTEQLFTREKDQWLELGQVKPETDSGKK